MNLLLLGITLGTIGKVILGVAVLLVHIRILQEQSIDWIVLRAIKREHFVTIVGLIFIVAGYILEVMFYYNIDLLSCTGTECSAALNTLF